MDRCRKPRRRTDDHGVGHLDRPAGEELPHPIVGIVGHHEDRLTAVRDLPNGTWWQRSPLRRTPVAHRNPSTAERVASPAAQ